MAKINPSGPVATGTANVITIGVLLWAIGGSTVLALVLSLWTAAREALFSPAGAVFAVVWFLCLSSALAFIALRTLSRPRKVITEWDCAYCIAIDASNLVFDSHSADSALQMMLTLRNLGNGPIRLKPEEFSLRIGDRVSTDDAERTEIVVARLSAKGMVSGTMRRDAIPASGRAFFTMAAIYGRHDGEFSRRFRVKGEVNFRLENDLFVGSVGISEEKDGDI